MMSAVRLWLPLFWYNTYDRRIDTTAPNGCSASDQSYGQSYVERASRGTASIMKRDPGPKDRNLSESLPAYISSREDGNNHDGHFPGSPEEYESLDDQELLGLIAQESREALEALYRRYSGPVYSLAMHILRDPGAAEEVAQDAFFNVWRRASSYRSDRGNVRAWLFSIAHHRSIDEVRRRKRRTQSLVFNDDDLINKPDENAVDPAGYATLQVQRTKIKAALSNLRPEQREVVVLAYFGGLTHSEIAERLQKPLGTVKTRMRLALKKLREVLGPQAQEWAEYEL